MNKEFEQFNAGVIRNSGYIYTTNAKLSSRMANQRLSDAALRYSRMKGKKVIDIGCGDGTYTIELHDLAKPSVLVGVDPAADAIRIAKERAGTRNIKYDVQNAYDLPYENDSFDVAQLRGVVHHMDDAHAAIREALRVARTVIIIEPNGYNLILKVLEKKSHYHVEHGEKSYAPAQLDRWSRSSGARVVAGKWVGLVPFFCPDIMAQALKVIEPVIERIPLINRISCAVYVLVITRSPK